MSTVLDAVAPETRDALLTHAHPVSFRAAARTRLPDVFAPHGSGAPIACAH